jgi:hypothetical protein
MGTAAKLGDCQFQTRPRGVKPAIEAGKGTKTRTDGRSSRSASIDGGKMPRWVRNDRFTMVARCPLLPQVRPDCCVALGDAPGHERTQDYDGRRPPMLRHTNCQNTAKTYPIKANADPAETSTPSM